jgi:hypothetical protein
MFAAVSAAPAFLATAETTRLPIFLRMNDSRPLFSHKVIVFATDSLVHFGVLSSAAHFAWFEETRTPRGATSSYTVTRVLRPFPFPSAGSDVASAAESFENMRLRALEKYVSVTKLYNAFDDRANADQLVVALRAAQVRLDEAVCRAYGWDDLLLEHGFFDFSAGKHFTVSPENRAVMRKRLLAENLRRAGAAGGDVAKRKSSSGEDTLFA